MKLQTKLTLSFGLLLLFMTGALLGAVYMVSQSASRLTAENTLRPAVESFASEMRKGKGRIDLKGHTYDNGAYLTLYSHDGTELLLGNDVFSLADEVPELLSERETGEVFLLDTEEARVYVCILPVDFGRGGKTDRKLILRDWEEEIIGEKGKTGEGIEEYGEAGKEGEGDAADEDGTARFPEALWAVGILPLEGMNNLMDSVVRVFFITIPLLVLLAAFCGWYIAGKSLRPLGQITLSARSICGGQDLSLRLPVEPRGDEVQELAQTFNGMMERLQHSFESERQFTSDAAHELRTPTAVILAECEMALAYPNPDPALTDSLEEIRRQARKMTDLIGTLLSYTRLEQGTRRIEKEKLELSELALDICEEQRAVAPAETEILFEGGKEVWVEGDVSLLIILLSNLISNAVKYGREGGHVWVRVWGEKNQARVSVRDDGIGISKKDLSRIWNRFYQADKARSDDGKRGVGLGLSLARQIARLHGGEIQASSTLGEGSEFLFTMPLTEA